MQLSRRSFSSGVLSAALATQVAAPAFAQSEDRLAAAITTVRAFGDADFALNRLPGMVLGIVTPDGRRTVMNFGYASPEAHVPIIEKPFLNDALVEKIREVCARA